MIADTAPQFQDEQFALAGAAHKGVMLLYLLGKGGRGDEVFVGESVQIYACLAAAFGADGQGRAAQQLFRGRHFKNFGAAGVRTLQKMGVARHVKDVLGREFGFFKSAVRVALHDKIMFAAHQVEQVRMHFAVRDIVVKDLPVFGVKSGERGVGQHLKSVLYVEEQIFCHIRVQIRIHVCSVSEQSDFIAKSRSAQYQNVGAFVKKLQRAVQSFVVIKHRSSSLCVFRRKRACKITST